MASGQVIVNGSNVLKDPSIGTNNRDGTMTINSGQAVFDDDDIIVLSVDDLTNTGEVGPGSKPVQMEVYDSVADYLAGDVKYTYTPQNPGQFAQIQGNASGLGDTYLRFNANVLVPSGPNDPTAPPPPNFNQLIFAADTDLTGEIVNGPITFNTVQDVDLDGDGSIDPGPQETGNRRYNIENNIFSGICFTRGTPIETARGIERIETLRPGDRIITRDGGLRKLRWIGQRETPAMGRMAPVWFAPDSIGNGLPLMFSPNHRVLLRGARAEELFGTPEVLATAKHLVNGTTIRRRPVTRITYVHLLFEGHQIVNTAGGMSESFYPGPSALSEMDAAARDEVLSLFPELDDQSLPTFGPAARHILTAREARAARDFIAA